jgi:hypothetical protein
MMENLTRESALFETIVTGAHNAVRGLGDRFATLSIIASRLEASNPGTALPSSSEARYVGESFDDLFLQYTMVRERDVHVKLSDRFGLARKPAAMASEKSDASADDVLFF